MNNNRLIAAYMHGAKIDEPLAMFRDLKGDGRIDPASEVFFFSRDGLGSVRDLTSANGKLVQRYRYSAYGITNVEKDQAAGGGEHEFIENPFAFAGGIHDWDTGLTQFGRRDLDHNSGRWISFDSAWPLGGLNGYDYVGGDPLNYRDTSGLWRNPWSIFDEALNHPHSSSGTNGPNNAFQHCFAACMMTAENGQFLTYVLGEGHEVVNDLHGQPPAEHNMDSGNNAFGNYLGNNIGNGAGISCGPTSPSNPHQQISKSCAASCGSAADSGILNTITPND